MADGRPEGLPAAAAGREERVGVEYAAGARPFNGVDVDAIAG